MSVDLTTDASTPRRDGSAAFHLPYGTFKLHLHDLRSLSDPNNGAYSACTGRRQEILNQILDRPAGRALMSMIFRDIEKAVKDHRPVIVMPYCTSNRHRSVAMGTLVSAGLYVHGVKPFSWSHACQRELAEDEVRRPLCLLPWVVRP